jgi:peptidase E
LRIIARTVHAGDWAAANFGPLYNDGAGLRDEHLAMEKVPRQIVAFGGGGFSMESGNPLLDDYVLGLCRRRRPRVCFLPSASGDADHYVVRFYRAFPAERCEASHISLFRREQGPGDLRRHLLEQDLIYVGGGSVVSLLGVWRAHGVDAILREAWRAGVVLCGLSAGSLCWFAEAVSGFHGAPRRVEGLGLLPHSNCVHYEPGSAHCLAYRDLLRAGMRPGFGAGDGAALHFVGDELSRVVASRPQARGYRLELRAGEVVETPLATTFLGDGAGHGGGMAGGTATAVAA